MPTGTEAQAATPPVADESIRHREDVLLAAETALLTLRISMQTLQVADGTASTEKLDGLNRDFAAFVERHGNTVAENMELRAEFTGLASDLRQIAEASGYSLDKKV